MKKKILLVLMILILALFAAACGTKDDGEDMVYNDATEVEAVNLTVIPDGCDLVPYEQFKTGFAMLCNTAIDAPAVTLSGLEDAFGTEGVYYPESSYEEDGIIYKTYAWFSDEDWLDSKVAVAVIFKITEESPEPEYYMYTSQGITYEDVQ